MNLKIINPPTYHKNWTIPYLTNKDVVILTENLESKLELPYVYHITWCQTVVVLDSL